MAYILAITELVYIVLVLVLGGTIGIGAIAFLLALAGAIRIDKNGNSIRKYQVEAIS